MFYESWQPGAIVDDSGLPLASGRVTVYVHDSNHLADIYTLEGDQYVPAQNPQRLDEAGRLSATLFMTIGVYDIKIEKDNGDGTFEQFDWYDYGIDAKLEQIGLTEVADIAALQDLDPDVSGHTVTVTSEPRRTYIWDQYSTDTPDGGIIVSSDVKGTGNWILLWDSPYLPSTIYGVSGTDGDNMSAFLTYQDTAGSMGLVMPPVAFIVTGNYNLQVNLVSTHKVAFDRNVRFTGSIMVPCDVEVLGPQNSYIGDIRFQNHGCTARSSWYPTVTAFWTCGADHLVCDNDNHFTNTVLQSNVTLYNKDVHGAGTLVTVYSTGTRFTVNQQSDIPDGFFTTSDYVQVTADIGDRIFRTAGAWDPGLIGSGNHQQFDVVPALGRWGSADRWMKTVIEKKNRTPLLVGNVLDLENRVTTGFTVEEGTFTDIRNARPSGRITVKGSVQLHNVTATVQVSNVSNSGALAIWDSDVTIDGSSSVGFAILAARNSRISVTGNLDPAETQIGLVSCSFNGAVYLSDAHADSYVTQQVLSMIDTEITGGQWRVNYLHLDNCSVSNKIDVLPSRPSTPDGYYYYNVNVQGCRFAGNSRIRLTVYVTYENPHTDMDGHVKFNTMRFVDNRFNGSDAYGIKMIAWHPYTWNRIIAQDVGNWTYLNNTGNCPMVVPPDIIGADEWPDTQTSGASVWRKNDSREYNVWCPDAYFMDGSFFSVERDPRGIGRTPLPLAVSTSMSTPASAGGWYFYGYRRYTSMPSDYLDEDANNYFRVNVGITLKLPSMVTLQNQWVTFPLPEA